MALNIVELPYSYFPDFSRGRALWNAQIFVGVVDTDPEIPGNQKQVTVRQEDGAEVQISQPVRTSSGGVPTYNGSPVTVLVDGAYSIKVLDRLGGEEYYSPDVTKGVPLTPESLPTYTDLVFDSVADMVAYTGSTPQGSTIQTNRYNVDVISTWSVNSSIPATHTDTINALQLNNGLYAILISDDGDVRHCGAGLASVDDEGPLWNASIKHVNKAVLPKGFSSYAREIELKDETYLSVSGTLYHSPNSPEWSRVLTNQDRVNGNKGFTVDFTDGVGHGNQSNQPQVNQHYFFFVNCSDCLWVGGTLKENKALDGAAEIPPTTNHPDGPFTQGVVRGEPSYTNPDSGFGYFIGGRNNHALGGIKLLNWQREGFSMRWVDNSSIGQITGISGPEVNYSEYAPVDWTTRAGTQSINVGTSVMVQNGYEFNGQEQQPYLIYSSLVSGSVDLGAEDYTNAARWTLVERDASQDYGYTVARITGLLVGQNSIYEGKGSFCRASTFSNDSEQCVMTDLVSYHNSFQVGINFGHANTPTDGSRASNLIAINPGWLGGGSGNSHGINVVANSDDVSIDNFYVCGAARNGLNVSDGGNRVKASNGTVKFSAAAGVLAFNAQVDLAHVTSKNNAGADFSPTSAGVMSLRDCRDSLNNLINNDRLIQTSRPNVTTRRLSDFLSVASAGSFAIPAGTPLVTIDGLSTGSDAMKLTVTYTERNINTSSAAGQRACELTFGIFGFGAARTVQILDTAYTLNRTLNCVWNATTENVEVYLQDTTPVNVPAENTNNSVVVEVQNSVTYDYNIIVG